MPRFVLLDSKAMLTIPYAPEVSANLVEVLEHHARHAGVSLDALEIIGSSLDFVEAFIVAAEDGNALDFIETLMPGATTAPAGKVERARWQAARLFGS